MRLDSLTDVCRRCTKCKQLKQIDEFYVLGAKTNRRRKDCLSCFYADNDKWRATESGRRKTNVTALRRHRQKRYGLTDGDLAMMLARQNGKCVICEKEINLEPYGCHVDHNHVTNEVRALLCRNCNWLIGHSGESPAVLRQAARYLEVFAEVK